MCRLKIRITSSALIVALSLSPVAAAELPSDVQVRIREVLDASYRLDYRRAEEIFQQLIRDHPKQLLGHGAMAVHRWNELLFASKNLALDDFATPTPFSKKPAYKAAEAERQRFLEANNGLLEMAEAILELEPKHVQALYALGLAHENLGAEAIAISKSLGGARSHGKKAADLHREVLELDPTLVDANTSIAVFEYVAASLPWHIKMFAVLLGYRGDKRVAIARLDKVAEQGILRTRDAQILKALLNAWKGEAPVAVDIFQRLRERYPENYLLDVNLAAIYDLQMEDGKAALGIYQELLDALPGKAAGIAPGEVHYRMGKVHLKRKDAPAARRAFQQALAAPRAEEQTAALAHYQLAEILWGQGQRDEARKHYRETAAYSGPAQGLEDELKQARRRVN